MTSDNKSWPDLVGKPVDEAVEVIKKENTHVTVIKLEEGSPITRDYRTDRVRVFYDKNGNVASKPQIG